MKFEKKLIILSGETRAKGTLSLERNAYGIFATVNIYNLDDLKKGEYRIGIKTNDSVFVERLEHKGRILRRFEICDMEICAAHGVVFNSNDLEPILYGTNAKTRLWKGNQMDGLRQLERRKQEQLEKALASTTAGLPDYSNNENKDIRNYFFDILPGNRIESAEGKNQENLEIDPVQEARLLLERAKQEAGYNDTLLAEDNYFEKDAFNYSTTAAVDKDELLNPVDKYLRELEGVEPLPWKENTATVDDNSLYKIKPNFEVKNNFLAGVEEIKKSTLQHSTQPWQLARDYLEREIRLSRNDEKSERKDYSMPQSFETYGSAAPGKGAVDSKNRAQQARESSEGQLFDNPPWHDIMPKTLQSAPSQQKVKSLADIDTLRANKTDSTSDEVAFTVPPVSSYSAKEAAKTATITTAFYDQVKPHINKLFEKCERYSVLEELMPQTKWAKVDFDEKRYFVVGIVGTGPDYICYGVPSSYTANPPKELGQDCRWLPQNSLDPQGTGYWLMFQSATTGEAEK